MLENQLSRYGAFSKVVPEGILAPGAKVFLVADSDDTTVGPINLGSEFPVDKDGVTRVFTTIQDAVNGCAGGRGDVVLVSPNYRQAFTRADSWNVAGVQIIGMGQGEVRPVLVYDDTAATVNLGADGVRVSNLQFLASLTRITRALDLDTGFFGQRVDNCIFTFDATGDDFVTSIRVGAKESLIENNSILMEDTAGPRQGIALLGGDPDRTVIRNNVILGQFDTVGDTNNSFGAISQDTSDTLDTNLTGVQILNTTITNYDTVGSQHIRFSAGYVNQVLIAGARIADYDTSSADTTHFAVAGGVRLVDVLLRSDSTQKTLGL